MPYSGYNQQHDSICIVYFKVYGDYSEIPGVIHAKNIPHN